MTLPDAAALAGLYLNELLAQFLMLKYPLDVAFNCFDTFISKHAPLTFVEDPSVHTYAPPRRGGHGTMF
jgi:hypothetical protein